MMAQQRVGFIGLGRMGKYMAGLLLDAGFPLTVWNRTISKTAELGTRGARIAYSPKELAEQSDVVISIILDEYALRDVSFDEKGVLAGLHPGSVFIDMSTVPPQSISNQVAVVAEEKGAKMLQAPVSGTTNWAAQGILTIFVSGDKNAYEKCKNILKVVGRKIYYLGQGEAALYYKLLVNMMVATTSQMLAEAMLFGKLAGLDKKQMVKVISGSVVASPILCHRAERIASGDYSEGMSVQAMAKDLVLAITTGRKLGAPLPTTALVHQFLASMEARGESELDHSSLFLLMENLTRIGKRF
jgi:3-hydroxyisobutyrate dehydrogenase-like beta-hydroxyacid dehydrogenase